MKSILLSAIVLLMAFQVMGQTSDAPNTRFISVTGSAEMEVAPDEIELVIILKEFVKNEKKKSELPTIEARFFEVLEKHGIPKAEVVLGDDHFYWYHWWSYRHERYRQKQYRLELDATTDFMSLVEDLDMKGVQSLRISNSTHSRIQELRKEVKISALKAAKDKAAYMLESIDERLGSVISVEEKPDGEDHYWRQRPLMSNVAMSSGQPGDDVSNVASIKLRYEVTAKFEIQ